MINVQSFSYPDGNLIPLHQPLLQPAQNAQLFLYPKVSLRFNKDLIAPNAIPNVKIIQIIWESLLDETNTELTVTSLLHSVKFATFVDKTREEFKKNYNNLSKFPKMNDEDWK